MKIRLELDSSITEDEIVIRCGALSDEIRSVQKALADLALGQHSAESHRLQRGGISEYPQAGVCVQVLL